MKLVSMIDFILEQSIKIDGEKSKLIVYDKIENYANFLKQPLKLEMFVPCDENDNVLHEGVNWNKNFYKKAKEKVLFLRFDGSDFDYSLAKVYLKNFYNIEQLSNEVKEQILTPNAIKLLNL